MVLKNQLFYWRKVSLIALLCALFLLVPAESISLVRRADSIALSSLKSYRTDLVLQKTADQQPGDIQPRSLIIPYSLSAFNKRKVERGLLKIRGVNSLSTGLSLWQLGPNGDTNTFVGLDLNEPKIGLRKVESLLIKGRFFSSNNADEIILERHFAKLFNLKPGDDYSLAGKTYKIVGIVDFKESSNLNNAAAFIPYESALRVLGTKQEIVNQVFIHLTDASLISAVSTAIDRQLPQYKLISQDSLLKNLSGINFIIIKAGGYFLAAVIPLALIVLLLTLKLYRLDFLWQRQILRTIGWDRRSLLSWQIMELIILLMAAMILAAILFLSLNNLLISQINLNLHLTRGLGQ